jgi:hypothetical protein
MNNDILLDAEVANKVWTILVEEGIAKESGRADFVHNLTNCGFSEWRCAGVLGFRAKLLKSYYPKFHLFVGAPPADVTADRSAIVASINRRLLELDY